MPYQSPIIPKGDQLKQRVIFAKSKIKRHMPQYMDAFLDMHPKYNNREGIQNIRSVMQLIKSDEVLTNELEAFANHLEKTSPNE